MDKQTGEQIKRLPQNADNVTPLAMSMNTVQIRKRKLSAAPSLVSVENIVVKIVPGALLSPTFYLLLTTIEQVSNQRVPFCFWYQIKTSLLRT